MHVSGGCSDTVQPNMHLVTMDCKSMTVTERLKGAGSMRKESKTVNIRPLALALPQLSLAPPLMLLLRHWVR